MVAIGPIFPEEVTFEGHVPVRNQMAALERAIAEELQRRGSRCWGSPPRWLP
jgi:hypothetical protein